MLQKRRRKQLKEHDWNTFHRLDKNPSQSVRRMRDHAVSLIEELSLIASKMPDDKQREVFNENTIEPLLTSLFLFDQSEKVTKLRNPNLGLASLLVEEGIKYCLSKYIEWNKDSPESSKPTIEFLERAIKICKEIGYKSFKEDVENSFSKKKSKIICIWENRLSSDFERFENYVIEQMGLDRPHLSIRKMETTEPNSYYHGLWDDWGDPALAESDLVGTLLIIFSLDKKEGQILDDNEGTMTLHTKQGEETSRKKIKILKYGSKHLLMEA